MRQSRLLGLLDKEELPPLNELVGLIALNVFNYCPPNYSQGSRNTFIEEVLNGGHRPKKLKDFKTKSTYYDNLACDCSSFVDSMWYLAHLIAKLHPADDYAYSSIDSVQSVKRNNPTTVTLANAFTTYRFNAITQYNFEIKQGSVRLQPGDIIIMHHSEVWDPEHNEAQKKMQGYVAITTQDGQEYGTTGHAQLYIGPGVYDGHHYDNLLIECGGEESGLIDKRNGLYLREKGPQISCSGGMGTTSGQYVLRKTILKPTSTVSWQTYYTSLSPDAPFTWNDYIKYGCVFTEKENNNSIKWNYNNALQGEDTISSLTCGYLNTLDSQIGLYLSFDSSIINGAVYQGCSKLTITISNIIMTNHPELNTDFYCVLSPSALTNTTNTLFKLGNEVNNSYAVNQDANTYTKKINFIHGGLDGITNEIKITFNFNPNSTAITPNQYYMLYLFNNSDSPNNKSFSITENTTMTYTLDYSYKIQTS